MHLLAFWVPGAAKWNWAVEHLLNQIQQYAIKRHGCGCRGPEFIKLLFSNLDALSALAGFDPNNPADTWHARPTHTLRLAEILEKIYALEIWRRRDSVSFHQRGTFTRRRPIPVANQKRSARLAVGLAR